MTATATVAGIDLPILGDATQIGLSREPLLNGKA
jgi:hypothetical protein